MSTRKGGLGRGLDSLIPTAITSSQGVAIANRDEIDINLIQPNSRQPRTVFDESLLNELAASIREVGILQPPVVRSLPGGKYELIMGERRLRAAKMAGLKAIPVIIRQTPDNELLREALLENIHRSELNALEEAAAYQNLLTDFGYTHDELAAKIGKSRPVISNTLRLLNLPAAVQRRIAAGIISAGHARALLSLTDEKAIEELANRIVSENLSVRAVEELVATSSGKSSSKSATGAKVTNLRAHEIQNELADKLDTRVSVELGKAKGKIVI